MLHKFLHAAAVLALLTGTAAMAQVGMVSGTVDGSVSGSIDRSVGGSVSGGAGGGGGGGTQTHSSQASWAPTLKAEQASKTTGGIERPGAEDEGFGSQAEVKKEAPKRGTKKFGAPAGPRGASTFGMAAKSDMANFKFNSRVGLAGGSGGSRHERSEQAQFEKSVAGHGTRSGHHAKLRGRAGMPKLRPLVNDGKSNCAEASSLQLCTGF